ncbi:hypothetical protein [Cohnella sp.]|uniref:hypothetical protein n=1 Tax=Cohnella sp. TaxID=1883426 RepID=UPI00370447BA
MIWPFSIEAKSSGRRPENKVVIRLAPLSSLVFYANKPAIDRLNNHQVRSAKNMALYFLLKQSRRREYPARSKSIPYKHHPPTAAKSHATHQIAVHLPPRTSVDILHYCS